MHSEVDLIAIRKAIKIYNEVLCSSRVLMALSEFQLWITKKKKNLEVESRNKLLESLP